MKNDGKNDAKSAEKAAVSAKSPPVELAADAGGAPVGNGATGDVPMPAAGGRYMRMADGSLHQIEEDA